MSRKWFWTNPHIIQIEPDNRLYDWIEKIGDLLAGSKTLFLIDDIIVDETVDKRRNSLLDLAISERHKGHLLWLLTQSYTALPLNKNALCLVPQKARRLGYCSLRERSHRNERGICECQEATKTE